MAVPLTIALIEAGVVTDQFLNRKNRPLIEVLGEPDERELAIRALSTWWKALQKRYPMRHFRWSLHVQHELQDYESRYGADPDQASKGTAWFCLTRSQNSDIPRVTLARRVGELEAVLEGFGQTALAVLMDATRYLPDSFTPWRALDCAHWLHWEESETDEELIAEQQNLDGCTREEAEASVLTRKEFYGDMPRWVTQPQRVRTREEIVRAARDSYTKSVITTCDDIAQLVNSPGFNINSFDIGAHNTRMDSIDGFLVLRWTERDAIGRVIDDALNMIGESGEYTEFIDAIEVPLTGAGLASYLSRMDQIFHLATLTEHLIYLLGDPL